MLPFVSNDVTRPKDRLILYFPASCLSSVPIDPLACTSKLSLHWASLHHHIYVRQYTGILAPLALFGTHPRPQLSLPVNVQSPQPLRRHPTLTFIIK